MEVGSLSPNATAIFGPSRNEDDPFDTEYGRQAGVYIDHPVKMDSDGYENLDSFWEATKEPTNKMVPPSPLLETPQKTRSSLIPSDSPASFNLGRDMEIELDASDMSPIESPIKPVPIHQDGMVHQKITNNTRISRLNRTENIPADSNSKFNVSNEPRFPDPNTPAKSKPPPFNTQTPKTDATAQLRAFQGKTEIKSTFPKHQKPVPSPKPSRADVGTSQTPNKAYIEAFTKDSPRKDSPKVIKPISPNPSPKRTPFAVDVIEEPEPEKIIRAGSLTDTKEAWDDAFKDTPQKPKHLPFRYEEALSKGSAFSSRLERGTDEIESPVHATQRDTRSNNNHYKRLFTQNEQVSRKEPSVAKKPILAPGLPISASDFTGTKLEMSSRRERISSESSDDDFAQKTDPFRSSAASGSTRKEALFTQQNQKQKSKSKTKSKPKVYFSDRLESDSDSIEESVLNQKQNPKPKLKHLSSKKSNSKEENSYKRMHTQQFKSRLPAKESESEVELEMDIPYETPKTEPKKVEMTFFDSPSKSSDSTSNSDSDNEFSFADSIKKDKEIESNKKKEEDDGDFAFADALKSDKLNKHDEDEEKEFEFAKDFKINKSPEFKPKSIPTNKKLTFVGISPTSPKLRPSVLGRKDSFETELNVPQIIPDSPLPQKAKQIQPPKAAESPFEANVMKQLAGIQAKPSPTNRTLHLRSHKTTDSLDLDINLDLENEAEGDIPASVSSSFPLQSDQDSVPLSPAFSSLPSQGEKDENEKENNEIKAKDIEREKRPKPTRPKLQPIHVEEGLDKENDLTKPPESPPAGVPMEFNDSFDLPSDTEMIDNPIPFGSTPSSPHPVAPENDAASEENDESIPIGLRRQPRASPLRRVPDSDDENEIDPFESSSSSSQSQTHSQSQPQNGNQRAKRTRGKPRPKQIQMMPKPSDEPKFGSEGNKIFSGVLMGNARIEEHVIPVNKSIHYKAPPRRILLMHVVSGSGLLMHHPNNWTIGPRSEAALEGGADCEILNSGNEDMTLMMIYT